MEDRPGGRGGRIKPSLVEVVRAYGENLPSMTPSVHPSPLDSRWRAADLWCDAEVVPVLVSRVISSRLSTRSSGFRGPVRSRSSTAVPLCPI
ncbi:hypothetical protein [Kibdelosporangium philippinense]|uniref:hypothetical protein n=1 Tax=Kibdelosporangium philippinense TaxID=211113 RepID=UPI003620CD78